MKTIDLHMHTTLSDGTDRLEDIIDLIREAGIELFSVTDHDSILSGTKMPQLLKEKKEQENHGTLADLGEIPRFIRGVEFSCQDELGKYHILGYGYDPDLPGIGEVVRHGHSLRMKKTKDRLAFLQAEFNFQFSEEEIERLLQAENPGKPHIARLMVKHGYAKDINEAISKYINKRKFRSMHVRPEDAIRGILASGGIPVLAHPFYGDGDQMILGEEMEQRLQHLLAFGLEGVEGYYSGFTEKLEAEILGLAGEYELYITAGSDYHGSSKLVVLGDTNLEDIADAPAGLHRFLQDVEIFTL